MFTAPSSRARGWLWSRFRISSGHEGRSCFGVTELIDVGVKKDLVRADVVLLKSCGVSMVAVGEALESPVAVDWAVGVLGSSSR